MQRQALQAATRKYIDDEIGLIDNVRQDLERVLTALNDVRGALQAADVNADDLAWTQLADRVGHMLQLAMPNTGVSLSRFFLEVNARTANLRLLRHDPGHTGWLVRQPALPDSMTQPRRTP